MSFGTDDWMVAEDKALPIIKHAFDNGLNTWDTVMEILISKLKLELTKNF